GRGRRGGALVRGRRAGGQRVGQGPGASRYGRIGDYEVRQDRVPTVGDRDGEGDVLPDPDRGRVGHLGDGDGRGGGRRRGGGLGARGPAARGRAGDGSDVGVAGQRCGGGARECGGRGDGKGPDRTRTRRHLRVG